MIAKSFIVNSEMSKIPDQIYECDMTMALIMELMVCSN